MIKDNKHIYRYTVWENNYVQRQLIAEVEAETPDGALRKALMDNRGWSSVILDRVSSNSGERQIADYMVADENNPEFVHYYLAWMEQEHWEEHTRVRHLP